MGAVSTRVTAAYGRKCCCTSGCEEKITTNAELITPLARVQTQDEELDEVAYSNVVKVTTDDEGPPVSSALSHRSTPSSRDDTTPTSTQKGRPRGKKRTGGQLPPINMDFATTAEDKDIDLLYDVHLLGEGSMEIIEALSAPQSPTSGRSHKGHKKSPGRKKNVSIVVEVPTESSAMNATTRHHLRRPDFVKAVRLDIQEWSQKCNIPTFNSVTDACSSAVAFVIRTGGQVDLKEFAGHVEELAIQSRDYFWQPVERQAVLTVLIVLGNEHQHLPSNLQAVLAKYAELQVVFFPRDADPKEIFQQLALQMPGKVGLREQFVRKLAQANLHNASVTKTISRDSRASGRSAGK
mmetsp:Transcript_27027/g.62441  ORF Transcript_27027/g.62441 Transcript_27027/m.62441 type:complete len:351 (+) Transcript_27027:74-1126(+)